MAGNAIIELRGVCKSLGGQIVLDGLDLEVQRSETLVIMGRSGAGKSVILKHVIGLMTPDVVEAQLNAVMIQVSREVVVVADASKFQRRSLSVIAKLDVVHKVITDSGTSPEILAGLRARNVEVIVV